MTMEKKETNDVSRRSFLGSRKNPIAPVDVGCRTNTLCCLANIATEL